MTVQDIKDYIDEKLSNKSTVIEDYHDTLIYIKYMLDQLEGKLEMLERIENDENLEEDFKKVAWEIAAENNELRYKLNQLDEQKINIDNIISKMRPVTKEELEGIDEYIKGISVTIDDE